MCNPPSFHCMRDDEITDRIPRYKPSLAAPQSIGNRIWAPWLRMRGCARTQNGVVVLGGLLPS